MESPRNRLQPADDSYTREIAVGDYARAHREVGFLLSGGRCPHIRAGQCGAVKQVVVYLWIAVGSAAGGIARFWASGVVARLVGETFPWGTMAVNVVGSFIIGFIATLTAPDGRVFIGSTARLALTAGR